MISENTKRPCVFENPLNIGGRPYTITVDTSGKVLDGNRLWPCSLALAEIISRQRLETGFGLESRVCAVGDGLGLPGIVAASYGAVVTVVDRDPRVWEFIYENYRQNRVWAKFRVQDWSQAEGEFDYIYGSEVTYPGYGLAQLVEFVARSWNGKGACAFTASSQGGADDFYAACRKVRLQLSQSLQNFTFPNGEVGTCFRWDISL